MRHYVSVDDATYATLKEAAKFDGRTMSGLVGFLIRDYAKKLSLSVDTLGSIRPIEKPLSEEERIRRRIRELNAALEELDEDSDAYGEIIETITNLQKQLK